MVFFQMNDIYEDIVNVGNNFDSLKIKLEDRTPDINSNLGVASAMQPIPVVRIKLFIILFTSCQQTQMMFLSFSDFFGPVSSR